MWVIKFFHFKYLFVTKEYSLNVFCVYFDSNFLEWIMLFSVFESVSFYTLHFGSGQRSRFWSIIWETDQQSILNSHAFSASVELSPWLISLAKQGFPWWGTTLPTIQKIGLSPPTPMSFLNYNNLNLEEY